MRRATTREILEYLSLPGYRLDLDGIPDEELETARRIIQEYMALKDGPTNQDLSALDHVLETECPRYCREWREQGRPRPRLH